LLEAKQISHTYGDYIYQPRPVVRPRPKAKNKNKNMLLAKVVVVGSVLFAVLIGLLLTATHAQITSKTDNIIRIKNEISDLQNTNERLKLEIARLKSLDRVELIATTELGMIQPGINEIEYIAFEDIEEAAVSPRENASQEIPAAVEVASEKKMHPIILAVNKLVFDYVYPKITPEE
jgi:cell division protein FtsL